MARKKKRYYKKKTTRHLKKNIFFQFFESVFWFFITAILSLLMWPFKIMWLFVGPKLHPYLGKFWGRSCETKNGEWVRGEKEQRIADFLFKRDIKYFYQKSINLWFGIIYFRPPFYIPSHKMVIDIHEKLGSSTHAVRQDARGQKQWRSRLIDRKGIEVVNLDRRHLDNNVEVILSKLFDKS